MKSLIVTKNVQKNRFEGDWDKKLFRKTITRKIYGRNSSFYEQKERETETERDYCISNSENYLTIMVRKKIFTVGGWKKDILSNLEYSCPFGSRGLLVNIRG